MSTKAENWLGYEFQQTGEVQQAGEILFHNLLFVKLTGLYDGIILSSTVVQTRNGRLLLSMVVNTRNGRLLLSMVVHSGNGRHHALKVIALLTSLPENL